jgi:hypothetical protein
MLLSFIHLSLSPAGQLLGDNLKSHLEALEEIGAAASKEFSLEKAMKAMKSDWSELVFSLLPYRDSGTHILSSVDDVQVSKAAVVFFIFFFFYSNLVRRFFWTITLLRHKRCVGHHSSNHLRRKSWRFVFGLLKLALMQINSRRSW